MNKYLAILFLFYFNNSDAQNYAPKNPGCRWIYVMPSDDSFEDVITNQKFNYNSKSYFQSLRKYSWGQMDTSYYRIEKNGTIYYLDKESKKESIEIPGQPKISFRWTSSDKAWQYEIVGLNETLKTPKKEFLNCLVIKAEQISIRDKNKLPIYFNYYSKSIGYVGSKVDGQLMAYLIEWKLK
jgi:hypothetical protein